MKTFSAQWHQQPPAMAILHAQMICRRHTASRPPSYRQYAAQLRRLLGPESPTIPGESSVRMTIGATILRERA
jgi:hypothetical protein